MAGMQDYAWKKLFLFAALYDKTSPQKIHIVGEGGAFHLVCVYFVGVLFFAVTGIDVILVTSFRAELVALSSLCTLRTCAQAHSLQLYPCCHLGFK